MAVEMDDDSMLIELSDQYKQLSSTISKALNTVPSLSPEQRWNEMQKIDSDLNQSLLTVGTVITLTLHSPQFVQFTRHSVDAQLKDLKQEVSALNDKGQWRNKFNDYQADYQALKLRLENQRDTAKSCGDYKKLDQSAAKVKQSNENTDILKETQRELYQIESNTEDLMVTLNEQHTQLDAIKAKTIASNNILDNMGKTLKKMKSRWWA